MTLDQYLADRVSAVNSALERLLPPENQYPETIHSAMRHSVFAGGKRIRPILFMAAAEAVPQSAEGTVPHTLEAHWKTITRGVFRLDERLFIILNVDAILTFD